MNEHTQFKIDTSGEIDVRHDPNFPGVSHVWWSDLSPFQQGAEGEARRELAERLMREGMTAAEALYATAFSRWAPSALQRIMADCSSFANQVEGLGFKTGKIEGERFWRGMQSGSLIGAWAVAYPPLTISLAEDGLIHLSEVG